MASSYCKVDFNWHSNKATNVTKYTFIDVHSSDFESVSFENRSNSYDDHPQQFFKQENTDNFIVKLVCSNPECSQINGISIVSESRTLEISNDTEGYITSVHGKRLLPESESNTEHNPGDTKFYVCSCSFEKPYVALSIKFLSLGKKESIFIRSITVNIQQHDLESGRAKIGGTFDMAKLKKDIEGMGDSVSDRALDFLATMEVFEQNKINSLGSMLGQDAISTMQSHTELGSSMNDNGFTIGMSSLMRSVLGDETMRNLKEDVSKNGEGKDTQNDSIYSMLQAVCGKVSKTRKTTKPEVNSSSEDTTVETDEKMTALDTAQSNFLLEMFNEKLEAAKEEMTFEVQKVKEEVMDQLEGMRREMTEKLDNISALLQVLVKFPNSQCMEEK